MIQFFKDEFGKLPSDVTNATAKGNLAYIRKWAKDL